MSQRIIPSSELIINEDNSVFHLHLRPEHLRDKIIVCGDRERVDMIAKNFDTIDYNICNREYHSIAGTYKGKRILALSHGIGPGTIDIMMPELDALANIDFALRSERAEHRTLEIVRVGTSGGLQPYVPLGSFVMSTKSIGFDGILNFYADRNKVADLEFEKAFTEYVKWNPLCARPYVVDSDPDLIKRIGGDDMIHGNTIASVGFYGPQGREVRLALAAPELNDRIESFEFNGRKITNYEMESAPLQGLATLLGHKALTVCCIAAQRVALEANTNYKDSMSDLIRTVLDRI